MLDMDYQTADKCVPHMLHLYRLCAHVCVSRKGKRAAILSASTSTFLVLQRNLHDSVARKPCPEPNVLMLQIFYLCAKDASARETAPTYFSAVCTKTPAHPFPMCIKYYFQNALAFISL